MTANMTAKQTPWTPGPWRFKADRFNGDHTSTAPGSIVSNDGGIDWYLATIESDLDGGDREVEANARLIAAAPHMFELLERVVLWAGLSNEDGIDASDLIARLRGTP